MAHETKDALLVRALVHPHTAAADFVPVRSQVVLLCANSAWIGVQQRTILFLETAEWVVGRVPAFTFFVPFEERKLVDPGVRNDIWIDELETSAQLVSERRQRFGYDRGLIGNEDRKVASAGADAFSERNKLRLGKELSDRGFDLAALQRDRCQSFGPSPLGKCC